MYNLLFSSIYERGIKHKFGVWSAVARSCLSSFQTG